MSYSNAVEVSLKPGVLDHLKSQQDQLRDFYDHLNSLELHFEPLIFMSLMGNLSAGIESLKRLIQSRSVSDYIQDARDALERVMRQIQFLVEPSFESHDLCEELEVALREGKAILRLITQLL